MRVLEDVRFALRLFAKRPWITAAIVAVLAAGISVNAAVFTFVNAVLIRGLPFEHGERIVYLASNNLTKNQEELRLSFPDYIDWRDQAESLEDIAASQATSFNLADGTSLPERLRGERITANTFSLLGVRAALGRTFEAGEDSVQTDPLVLLGYGVWQRRYGGDSAVLGRTIRVDGIERTVVGVMPRGFRFPFDSAIWVPLTPDDEMKRRDRRRLSGFGLLAPGASLDQVRAELDLIAGRLQQEHGETNEGVGAVVMTFNEKYNGGNVRVMFLAMLGAVGFVLLIACANVANIQLARAADRQREMSIRRALGAGRWPVIRQLIVENVLLAVCGGLLGLGISWFGIRAFDVLTKPVRPYWIEFTFDAVVFSYLAMICLAAGALFGMAPAIQAARVNINDTLKQGSRGQTAGSQARHLSSALVVAEVFLATVLMVSAGLMVHSFWNIYTMDLGVRTDKLLTLALPLSEIKYPKPRDRVAFQERLMPSILALPGVESAAVMSHLPAGFSSRTEVEFEGKPADNPEERPREPFVAIGAGYFRTFGASLFQGRDFTAADRLDSLPVAIVNQRFAQKHWPGENPLGKRVRLGDEEERAWVTIVGISPNIRQNITERDPLPVLYRPFTQDARPYQRLALRTEADPVQLADAVRAVVARIDQDLPAHQLGSFEEQFDSRQSGYKLLGGTFLIFAMIALVLAATGIYAVVADSVGRRRGEFGIRMALGAQAGQILRLVLSQGMRRVALGLALGLPAAYGAGRVLSSLTVGVPPSDLIALGGVASFLAGVAVLACWIPALRASRTEPGTLLRYE